MTTLEIVEPTKAPRKSHTMDPQVDATAEVKYIPEVTLAADITVDDDTHIIDFDGEGDPKDPLNWSKFYKWSMVILISLLSLVVYVALHSAYCLSGSLIVADPQQQSSDLALRARHTVYPRRVQVEQQA